MYSTPVAQMSLAERLRKYHRDATDTTLPLLAPAVIHDLQQAADELERLYAAPAVTRAMVDRFLCWPLPKDFGPDCHISFKLPDPVLNPNPSWPVGTNLFTADQARAMLEHVLSDGSPREHGQ